MYEFLKSYKGYKVGDKIDSINCKNFLLKIKVLKKIESIPEPEPEPEKPVTPKKRK